MGFSDLTSSSRGPGVIGTVLALLVLVGFGSLYMLVYADAGKPGSKRIDVIVREQETELVSDQAELTSLKSLIEKSDQYKSQAVEIEALTRQTKSQASQISGLESDVATNDTALNSALKAFEDYKNAYRKSVRESAEGEKLPVLKTNAGKIFQEVTIRKVDAVGMDIRHSQGFTRVDYEDLPLDIQDRFQFDAKQKQEAVHGEGKVENGYRDSAEIVMMSQQYAEKNQRITQLKESSAQMKSEIDDFVRNDGSYKSSIEQMRSRIASEEGKSGGIKRTPQMKVDLASMEARYRELKDARLTKERLIRTNQSTIEDIKSQMSQLGLDIARKRDEMKAKAQETAPAPNQ